MRAMEALVGNEGEGIGSADGQQRWVGNQCSVHSMGQQSKIMY